MEIRLPKDKSGLRIRHMEVLTDDRLTEDAHSLEFKVSLVARMAGVDKLDVYQGDLKQVEKAYLHCIGIIASVNPAPVPPYKLTVNGKEYELINIDKAPAGWHMDVSLSDFEADPVRMACLSYIPAGTKYGAVDEHKNLLYPIASRYDDFAEHFPLETYTQLAAFFLSKYAKRIAVCMAQEKATEKTLRILNRIGIRGSHSLT